MEKDGEWWGDGNSYTTQFRQYDPGLGRWRSLDSLMSQFPSASAFEGLGNNPISFVDPNGLAPTGGGDDGDPKKNIGVKHLWASVTPTPLRACSLCCDIFWLDSEDGVDAFPGA